MKHIVILISGRGTNMRAIVEACSNEGWPAQIAAVISNKPEADGIAWAQQQGIATRTLDHRLFADRAGFDAALQACIDEYQPDLVVLAGFMRILTPQLVNHYAGRMLNIHPSLLPRFPGLHTHRQALAAGVTEHGASVHFVTPELDHGPVITQAAVPVLPGDDEDSLAMRVLHEEHRIYPQAVRWFVQGRVSLQNGAVVFENGPPQLASSAALTCAGAQEVRKIS